jgi:hypothetical protein
MRHITVYREAGRFAGWPANYGIWSWGDEIVVGFTLGHQNPHGGFHARDKTRPFVAMQARSLDGGKSWQIEGTPWPTPGNRGVLSADEHVVPELSAAQAIAAGLPNAPAPCPGDVDFTHPDFALMAARTGLGTGTVAWFYLSTDRCRTWRGPYSLPMLGQAGVEARTDYLVASPQELMLFLTAARMDGGEGAGVFVAKTADGGRTFELVSWVARQADGYVIMPSSVRLSAARILSAVRCREGGPGLEQGRCWIDLHVSEDNGVSFHYLATPVPDTGHGGNPPMLLQLADGRLCLTYGYRAVPYGIRAVLSQDGGATWGPEVILRDDAGNHDLGYPRSVQRKDGVVVTVYYTNDCADGDRYLAATLWRP